MNQPRIPKYRKSSLKRLQSLCPHLHTVFTGGWHLRGGEVWDDITEICSDCGANLDEQPNVIHFSSSPEDDEIPI